MTPFHYTESELTNAYRDYLERMVEESDDLVTVDKYTVPMTVDPTSPTAQEWATFE